MVGRIKNFNFSWKSYTEDPLRAFREVPVMKDAQYFASGAFKSCMEPHLEQKTLDKAGRGSNIAL